MIDKVFLATFNGGKIERFKKLIALAGLGVKVFAPQDLNIEDPHTEENGSTLAENAEIKARAFLGKVDMPILSNDTGFWVEGKGLVDAPKRLALGDRDEKDLSHEEKAKVLADFWKGIAAENGGKVDAAWMEEFALLFPDGAIKRSSSKREIILTDGEFGVPHVQLPMRALYLSKATGKPAVNHTAEEEELELKPVTNALVELLTE